MDARNALAIPALFEFRDVQISRTSRSAPGSMLKMMQNPAPDVEHTLLVCEPFRPANLPADDVLELACDLLAYFP